MWEILECGGDLNWALLGDEKGAWMPRTSNHFNEKKLDLDLDLGLGLGYW